MAHREFDNPVPEENVVQCCVLVQAFPPTSPLVAPVLSSPPAQPYRTQSSYSHFHHVTVQCYSIHNLAGKYFCMIIFA